MKEIVQFKVRPGQEEFTRTMLELMDNGYIAAQYHPSHPLAIYNYTQKTQYEKLWNDVTMQCRGLILDYNYAPVSVGFPKFFNLSEYGPDWTPPKVSFIVYEKLDGSFLISYRVNGKLYWASKGSFTSDQANWANDIWQRKYRDIEPKLPQDLTLIGELIHPQNRVVVDYGDMEDIVILSTFLEGTEVAYNQLPAKLPRVGVHTNLYGAHFIPTSMQTLEGLVMDQKENAEGYVIRFENGLRVKVKYEEYLRLHRIVTQVSSKDIWQALKDGDETKFNALIENVPDEFLDWVEGVAKKLFDKVEGVLTETQEEYDAIREELGENASRKEWAKIIKECRHQDILFGILDGKNIEEMAWKKVKPKYEQPFKKSTMSDPD